MKQIEAILSLFNGEEQKIQAGLEYLKKCYSDWSMEVTKALLKSNTLDVKVKKSLLFLETDSSEGKQKVEVCLDKEMYEIPLSKPEKIDGNRNTLNTINENSTKVSEKVISDQSSILKKQAIIQILEGYTKEKLILIVKAYKISGYSKLNKKGLTELIGKEIIEKAPSSLEIKNLGEFQKIIDLKSEHFER